MSCSEGSLRKAQLALKKQVVRVRNRPRARKSQVVVQIHGCDATWPTKLSAMLLVALSIKRIGYWSVGCFKFYNYCEKP
jgi:hypothetical protein